jgi:hypothetical protein
MAQGETPAIDKTKEAQMTNTPCPVELTFPPKQALLDRVREIIGDSADRETQ